MSMTDDTGRAGVALSASSCWPDIPTLEDEGLSTSTCPHLERTSAAQQGPDDAVVQEAVRHEARALYRLLLAPMIGAGRAE